jgi:hypothetical protein
MPADTETLATTARAVLEDVLETMFFTTAVAMDCRDDPGAISARVHFNGEPSGEFELTLSPGAARQFAIAFLGCDEPDLPPEAEAEVSCELANMICGAALSRMHPDAVVKLNAPYVCDPASPLHGTRQFFEAPEGTLSITMRVD